MTTPELSNLTADWIREYEKANPGTRFSVKTFSESGVNNEGTICFVTEDHTVTPDDWKISIGHDVIVPVLNAKNPMFRQIMVQGFSAPVFALIYSGPIRWSDLIKNGPDKQVNQYIRDNTVVKTGVADFIQKEPSSLNPV